MQQPNTILKRGFCNGIQSTNTSNEKSNSIDPPAAKF